MNTIKITTTPQSAVKTLFTNIYGFEPLEIINNGSFYWADKVGFSLISKFIIKNNLENGK